MAVQQVMPERRQALDTVLKGLQAAQSISGLKSDYDQAKLRDKQMKLMEQQEKHNELKYKDDETLFETRNREAWLQKTGTVSPVDYNKEWFKVDDKQLKNLQSRYNYPWNPVLINVESFDEKSGQRKFEPTLSISKDDLKQAQTLMIQEKNYGLLKDKVNKAPAPSPNAGTFNAAGFADRMIRSNKLLDDLENSGFNRADFGNALAANATSIGGELTSAFKPEELKLYEQAKQDFILAQLRDESGAAIGTDEYKQAEKIYFPQAGDSPEVIRQKKMARVIAQENMLREAQYGFTGTIRPMTGGGQKLNIKAPNSSEEKPDDFVSRYLGG